MDIVHVIFSHILNSKVCEARDQLKIQNEILGEEKEDLVIKLNSLKQSYDDLQRENHVTTRSAGTEEACETCDQLRERNTMLVEEKGELLNVVAEREREKAL